jgi:hypothetical protein
MITSRLVTRSVEPAILCIFHAADAHDFWVCWQMRSSPLITPLVQYYEAITMQSTTRQTIERDGFLTPQTTFHGYPLTLLWLA